MDSSLQPHVMDFGLAKRMTESTTNVGLTVQGLIIGTPSYMSPEQAEGRSDVERRSDVYSLGVMLFEIAAGRVPFQASSPIQLLMKVIKEAPPLPTQVAQSMGFPAVDSGLERVALKGLSKKPGDRYATAAEFAQDLQRWLDGHEVTAPRTKKTVKRVPGSTARHLAPPKDATTPSRWAVTAVAGGLLVLALSLVFLRGQPSPPGGIDYSSADSLFDKGSAEDSLKAYESILRLHPGDERAQGGAQRSRARILSQHLDEAERLMSEGKLTAALVAFGKALASDPNNLQALRGQREAERRIDLEKSAAALAAVNAEKTRSAEKETPLTLPPPLAGPPAPAKPTALLWHAAAAVDEKTLAPGIAAHYFSDRDLGQLAIYRVDQALDFHWKGSAWPGGPSEAYSVRWEGYLRIPSTGTYTLRVQYAGGLRLFLDEETILANWTPHPETADQAPLQLEEGFHAFRLEYAGGGILAAVALTWSDGLGAPQPIPSARFFHRPFPAPPPSPAAPGAHAGPAQRLWDSLVQNRKDLRGQKVTVQKAGLPEATALIKDVGERDVSLVVNVAGGGTIESRETLDSLSPATLLEMVHRVWPKFQPDDLRMVCGWIADRGDLETAWKEAERARAAGVDYRESVVILLERERARIEGLKSTADKAAALKKLLSSRSALLGDSQRKTVVADLAALEVPGHVSAPRLQERPGPPGHVGEGRTIAISPDGRLVASGGYDGGIRLWETQSGQLRFVLKQGLPLRHLVFSPDGKSLATSAEGDPIRIWDPATGTEKLAYTGHTLQVPGLAFSPDSRLVASASTDATARVWEAATGKERAVLRDHPMGALVPIFSADGKTLYVATADHQIQIWDWMTSAFKGSLNGHTKAVWGMTLSGDGRSLLTISTDGTMKIWDLASRKDRATLPGPSGQFPVAAFSPDGRVVASLGNEGIVKFWDIATAREILSLKVFSSYGRALAFSPNGRILVMAGYDPSFKIFDVSGIGPGKP